MPNKKTLKKFAIKKRFEIKKTYKKQN